MIAVLIDENGTREMEIPKKFQYIKLPKYKERVELVESKFGESDYIDYNVEIIEYKYKTFADDIIFYEKIK